MNEFDRLLEEYKNMYLQFLVTGLPQYKTAYKLAQEKIEKAISEKQGELEHHEKSMKQFTENYKKDNDDIKKLNNASSEMLNNAQEIHDSYEASKKRFHAEKDAVVEAKVDFSTAYSILLRIGIIIMLIPILLYVSGTPLVVTKVFFQKVAEVMPAYAK